MTTERDKILFEIAKDWFNVETLETRGLDCLDFYDVGIGCIRKALAEAYEAGRKAAQ